MKPKYFLIFSFLLLFSNVSFSQFFFLNDTTSLSQYYTSGGHDAEIRGITSQAFEHFKTLPVGTNDVIVFDVDETSLSNFNIFRASHFIFDAVSYNNQLETESSPAIQPVLELYNALKERGFKIFFITGRDYNDFNYTHTLGNLQKSGYTNIDTLILRPTEYKTSTAQEYKSTIRAELVTQGYNFVGNVGDQWSDMAGENAGYRVRITNYMYCIK